MGAPLWLECACVRLRQGATIAEAAAAAGFSERGFRKAFRREMRCSPRAWRKLENGPQEDNSSPVVSFRLAEYEALAELARRDGVTPAAKARDLVSDALKQVPPSRRQRSGTKRRAA